LQPRKVRLVFSLKVLKVGEQALGFGRVEAAPMEVLDHLALIEHAGLTLPDVTADHLDLTFEHIGEGTPLQRPRQKNLLSIDQLRQRVPPS
jgi:hypothetical protein